MSDQERIKQTIKTIEPIFQKYLEEGKLKTETWGIAYIGDCFPDLERKKGKWASLEEVCKVCLLSSVLVELQPKVVDGENGIYFESFRNHFGVPTYWVMGMINGFDLGEKPTVSGSFSDETMHYHQGLEFGKKWREKLLSKQKGNS